MESVKLGRETTLQIRNKVGLKPVGLHQGRLTVTIKARENQQRILRKRLCWCEVYNGDDIKRNQLQKNGKLGTRTKWVASSADRTGQIDKDGR